MEQEGRRGSVLVRGGGGWLLGVEGERVCVDWDVRERDCVNWAHGSQVTHTQ